MVYGDICRAQFVTRISEKIEAGHGCSFACALVRMECRNRESDQLTYSIDGHTDKEGIYRLPVDGEHEEEMCEIVLENSNKPVFEEISQDPLQRKNARVSLTKNNGIATPIRPVNPLGFLRAEALPQCVDVLKELGMTPTILIGSKLSTFSFDQGPSGVSSPSNR
ncbi:hypothetical protein SAY86_010719 [Trapa natans]|uniref:Uncharacterized protein n=1 Tax=Trapa natans TaxID=22666 RepID=A0AAN7R4G7_TRANT|nr:hypothetical protein SAY86_010719 [Trapa natans]